MSTEKPARQAVGRLVRPDDGPALADLFEAIADPRFQPHPMTAAAAEEIAAYDGKDVYAVLESEDGQLLAYGLLRGWDEGYAVPSLGVAVRADHRRRGYGRQMMVWLGEEARRRGADRIRLRVHEDNRAARDLYSALGYVVTGEERGELVMVLELAAR